MVSKRLPLIKEKTWFEASCRRLSLKISIWRRPENISAETLQINDDNSPKTPNDKNYQTLFQNFRKFTCVFSKSFQSGLASYALRPEKNGPFLSCIINTDKKLRHSHFLGYGYNWLAGIVVNQGLDLTNFFSSFFIVCIGVKLSVAVPSY